MKCSRENPAAAYAQNYARALLKELGCGETFGGFSPAPAAAAAPADGDAAAVQNIAARWLRSGLPWLTGFPEQKPGLPRPYLPGAAEGALLALRALAENSSAELAALDAPALLGERAALLNLQRAGRRAPGGHCRLYQTADGWLALNLARGEADARLLPALLERDFPPYQNTRKIEAALSGEFVKNETRHWLRRGRLLGLAVAPANAKPAPLPWLKRESNFARASTPSPKSAPNFFDGALASRAPLVLDLGSLWAGPLCGALLQMAGARVIKIESLARPDGARAGHPDFYNALNAGKQSAAFNFQSAAALREMQKLFAAAGAVIESARPRALQQLGFCAHEWLEARPGRVWLSITGYGRETPQGQWTAFGDDAAAAAGLPWQGPAHLPAPLCIGDAVADPLAGLHAAAAALASLQQGGGELLSVALAGVVQRAIAAGPLQNAPLQIRESAGGNSTGARYKLGAGKTWLPLAPPAKNMRAPREEAAALGAHTKMLSREFGAGKLRPCK